MHIIAKFGKLSMGFETSIHTNVCPNIFYTYAVCGVCVCMLKFVRTFLYIDINYVREKEIDCLPKNKTWEEEKSETQINNCTKLFFRKMNSCESA
jgi:hypothetical protein